MRISNILIGASMAMATGATAQTMKMYDGFSINHFSPDGKWLVQNISGTTSILNADTEELTELWDANGQEMYTPGLGNSVTNSGKICILTMNSGAKIWDNGTLVSLPQPSGQASGFNTGNAFSADESRIVGTLGNDNIALGGDGMVCFPVVWDKNAAGEYVCKALPYQGKDFSGGTPQHIVASVMSDDGHTIAGTLTSWSGFYVFPIVFKEDAAGNWQYKLLGKELIYDESKLGTLPEMPVEPAMPDYNDYMSDDDKANYSEALEIFEEENDLYNNGLIDTPPTYPQAVDYISDADKKESYTLAYSLYTNAMAQYTQKLGIYNNKLNAITTGYYFTRNNMILSGNGRYLVASLVNNGVTTPGYFDLEEDDPKFVPALDSNYSMLPTAVLDDGTMFAASPVTELTRSSFVIAKDSKKPTPLYDWLKTKSEKAAQWLADNNTYKVGIYGSDGETLIGEKDSIVSGTIGVSNDGKVLAAYYTDVYSGGTSTPTKSYVINLDGADGITEATASESHMNFRFAGSDIRFEGVEGATVYDMSGRAVASLANGSSYISIAKSGAYVVRMTAKNGEVRSEKIIIK